MGKSLILFPYKDMYYFNRINEEEYLVEGIFKSKKQLNSFIVRFLRKIKSQYVKFFYQSWYKNLSKYDKIIVFDSALEFDPQILNNIVHKNKDANLFFYSWNMVTDENDFVEKQNLVKKMGFKMYSYDNGDCQKYNLNFNTIMYDPKLKIKCNNEKYDSIFVGYLKDKKEKIILLSKIFQSLNLIPKFIIVNSDEIEEKNEYFEYRNEYLNYYEYLDKISYSKSILDITQKNQNGYSMRVMEAIYFNKKLITTNLELKNAEFYDPNNIYVIEFDNINIEELDEFFKAEIHPYESKVKEYYSIKSWVDRFQI